MREKGQTEVAKTLETPVFSRGIEILTEKSKFLKKLLSAMLVGTAVCSLAACSGGADTGEPAETQTEESAGVQAEAEDTDAGQEPAAGEETDAAAGEGGALVA